MGIHFTRSVTTGMVAGAVALACASPDMARAQEARPVLDQIIVTARQRAESLQEVPLSIGAFSAEELERRSIVDLYDVANLTAGLDFNDFKAGSLGTPVIRGLAQTSVTSLQNNVAVFLDGVFIGGKPGINLAQLELERIEVVKGPQSARYGRNAFAGAINYVTKKPGDEFEGRVSGTLGSESRLGLSASVSGPLGDMFAGRLAAGFSSWDGSYRNQANPADYPTTFPGGDSSNSSNIGGHEYRTLNASLTFTPTETLEMTASVYYSDDSKYPSAWRFYRNNCGNTHFTGEFRIYCGELPELGRNDLTLDPRTSGIERESLFASLAIEYFLGDFKITSLTGYNEITMVGFEDNERVQPDESASDPTTGFLLSDGTRQRISVLRSPIASPQDSEDFSQELRIDSPLDANLRWTAGGFYARSKYLTEVIGWLDFAAVPDGLSLTPVPTIYALNPIPGAPGFAWQTLQNDTLTQRSLFAAIDYDVNERLTLGAEARLNWDELRAQGQINVTPVTDPRLQDAQASFRFLTPRFSADYTISEDWMMYASAARGAKAGGFNTRGTDEEIAFGPETNWTYELGSKSMLFGGRVRANAAVFYTDWSDLQFLTPSALPGLAFNVTANIGSAIAKGFEVDIDAAITDQLSVKLGYTMSDATFSSGSIDFGRIPDCDGSGDCSSAIGGNQLPRYSKHQAVAGVFFTQPLTPAVDFFISGDYSYRSKQYADTTNARWVGSRDIVNAKVGVQGDNWDVSLWGKNLLNDKTPLVDTFAPRTSVFLFLSQAIYGDLRHWGLTGTYRF